MKNGLEMARQYTLRQAGVRRACIFKDGWHFALLNTETVTYAVVIGDRDQRVQLLITFTGVDELFKRAVYWDSSTCLFCRATYQ